MSYFRRIEMSSSWQLNFYYYRDFQMERMLTMSQKELDRTEVLSKVKQKILTQQQAAEILHISPRHVRRLFQGYKITGAQALISKKRGKPSNHQLPSGIKELVPALIKEHYVCTRAAILCSLPSGKRE
jgi:predicted XRE-type DNA-binding protein